MERLVILGKIELPVHIKKDIICPICGKNCNASGLIVNYKGELQPCEECVDNAQFEYFSQLNENYELEREYDRRGDKMV